MHGVSGPWSNRPGFDLIGAAVAGVFSIEGMPTRPKLPPIFPICDNVVGWLGMTGILAALPPTGNRRRQLQGRGIADEDGALAAVPRDFR